MAHAIAEKDEHALRALFSTPVVFRGVTPRRFWDAETAVDVVDVVLGAWFGDGKVVTQLISVESGVVGDLHKISYRMAVEIDSAPTVIEQVGYYGVQAGHITDMRLVCSGFRRTGSDARPAPARVIP